MKKYELTENVKVIGGETLYQIRALWAFGKVEKEELGGWIAREENLNQNGNAFISGKAQVCDAAYVSGEAYITDERSIL